MDNTVAIFEKIGQKCHPSYKDNGIALFDDVRSLLDMQAPLFLSDAALLIFVRAGYMHVEVDGEGIRITTRHCIFCRSGHSLGHPSYSPNFSGHAVLLSMRFGQQMLAVAGNLWKFITHIDSKPVMDLAPSTLQIMRRYYGLLKAEVERHNNMYYGEIVTSIVRAMLCTLINDIRSDSQLVRDTHGELEPEYSGTPHMMSLFNRFLEMLTTEKSVNRKIDYYASRLFVTPKYLSAVCKRVSKRTAHQWITESIVNGIDNYLRYSDKSIKEISVIYGFPNLSFFSKYVKKHLGVSPNKYRER